MKTMTCTQLGGPCDDEIIGNTPDELMSNGMKHLEAAHPQMAADVKAAPKDDPKMVEWSKKFHEDWAKTPDSV
jgi:predicted small metal-binding protein